MMAAALVLRKVAKTVVDSVNVMAGAMAVEKAVAWVVVTEF